MNSRTLYFEDIATALDYWKKTAAESMARKGQDLIWADNPELFEKVSEALVSQNVSPDSIQMIMEEILRGFATSMLTILDGGTDLSDHTLLKLQDEEGNELTELREGFVSHLFDTQRLS